MYLYNNLPQRLYTENYETKLTKEQTINESQGQEGIEIA